MYRKAALALLLLTSTASASPLVVLIPGSGSSADQIWVHGFNWFTRTFLGARYFGKFQDELTARGIQNLVCPKAPDGDRRTIEEREEDCAQAILAARGSCAATSPREVILLGHSMGGLVARELAQDARVARCIDSVTTVSTPNQGSPIADFAIAHAESHQLLNPYKWIVELIDFIPRHLHYLPELRVDRAGAPAGTFAAQDLADNPEVAYFSFTTSMRRIPNLLLEVTRGLISKEVRERGMDATEYGAKNDGIVPEYSMPHGTCLGHIEAYHWASACVDPVASSKECRRSLDAIMPLLQNRAHVVSAR